MTADKGTTDRPGTEAGRRHVLSHVDRLTAAREVVAIEAEARADDRLRAALDVPTVERVLRRYFQAVDATGRSRSWWRVRAEEVAAALASTESDRPALDIEELALLKRVARMGSCSQTHHAHIAHDAAILAAKKDG